MNSTSKLSLFGALALVLSVSGTALAGHKHPGYMRTIDDLRLARALLQRTNVAQSANDAEDEVSLTVGYIDAVTAEIDKEINANQKKLRAIPRINPRISWADRLAESLKLLERAELDCSKEKDDAENAGLHARVFGLLDQAHTRMTVAIETKNFDYSARSLPTRND
jgi:hypothetical protein